MYFEEQCLIFVYICLYLVLLDILPAVSSSTRFWYPFYPLIKP